MNGSRLLVIEEVAALGRTAGNPNRFGDLDLIIHLEGEERTEREYANLMREAGFSMEKTVPAKDSFFSVIEGTLACLCAGKAAPQLSRASRASTASPALTVAT